MRSGNLTYLVMKLRIVASFEFCSYAQPRENHLLRMMEYTTFLWSLSFVCSALQSLKYLHFRYLTILWLASSVCSMLWSKEMWTSTNFMLHKQLISTCLSQSDQQTPWYIADRFKAAFVEASELKIALLHWTSSVGSLGMGIKFLLKMQRDATSAWGCYMYSV